MIFQNFFLEQSYREMKKKLELVRCDVEKRLREHGFFVKHVKRNEKNHNYSSSSSQQLNGRINAFVMRINLSNGRGNISQSMRF